MNLIRQIALCLIFVSFASNFQAQVKMAKAQSSSSLCNDYHKSACKFAKEDIYFSYNSQSRDALFRPGQTSKLTFTATRGYDYRMTFAAQNDILGGGQLSFKIWDAKTKKEIYNSEEDSAKEFEFICDSSINLTVEIHVPDSGVSSDKKVLYGCVGFLLESRRTLDTGF